MTACRFGVTIDATSRVLPRERDLAGEGSGRWLSTDGSAGALLSGELDLAEDVSRTLGVVAPVCVRGRLAL